MPSPTFTLVQTYAGGRLPVAHFDLYRLGTPDELDEIGFDEAAADGAVLVEWPERAGDRLPADRLDIALEIAGAGRRATLAGAGDVAGAARAQPRRARLPRPHRLAGAVAPASPGRRLDPPLRAHRARAAGTPC